MLRRLQPKRLHPGFFFLVFPADVIVLPYLMRVCSTFFQFQPSGELEEEMENPEMVNLPEKQKHQLRHRELFLSRQLESLPATHIRYAYILCLPVLFLLYLHFKVFNSISVGQNSAGSRSAFAHR